MENTCNGQTPPPPNKILSPSADERAKMFSGGTSRIGNSAVQGEAHDDTVGGFFGYKSPPPPSPATPAKPGAHYESNGGFFGYKSPPPPSPDTPATSRKDPDALVSLFKDLETSVRYEYGQDSKRDLLRGPDLTKVVEELVNMAGKKTLNAFIENMLDGTKTGYDKNLYTDTVCEILSSYSESKHYASIYDAIESCNKNVKRYLYCIYVLKSFENDDSTFGSVAYALTMKNYEVTPFAAGLMMCRYFYKNRNDERVNGIVKTFPDPVSGDELFGRFIFAVAMTLLLRVSMDKFPGYISKEDKLFGCAISEKLLKIYECRKGLLCKVFESVLRIERASENYVNNDYLHIARQICTESNDQMTVFDLCDQVAQQMSSISQSSASSSSSSSNGRGFFSGGSGSGIRAASGSPDRCEMKQ